MTVTEVLAWVAFPYIAATSFFVGHIIRFRYDKYGWTSRSSQTYENKLLAWGSPLFHYGIFGVFAGHALGLFIPREWTEAIGIDEHAYHLIAVWGGSIATAVMIAGIIILLIRRSMVGRVVRVTTTMDVVMYTLLVATVVFGTAALLMHQIFGEAFNYRGTISPWLRSLMIFQPDVTLMTGVPLAFQLHVLTAVALFLIWPYTRLVHVLSAPFGYLFRPYVVYRSRDAQRGARKTPRGWEHSYTVESDPAGSLSTDSGSTDSGSTGSGSTGSGSNTSERERAGR